MKRIAAPLFFILISASAFGQDAYIKGKISDLKTKETLVGVPVAVDDSAGTVSDINGDYFFKTSAGKHTIKIKSIGYKSLEKEIELKENDTLSWVIGMEQDSKELGIIVVSAGKYEQNLNEVTVSMEVLKPSLIENKSLQSIENAVDQVPGVNVIDGQANIRGGAGFSYGAGSRVLVMVDEMPMLTADAGDVKWTFLPVENCEQIEVIKGASSALFGSSAMNGVINFRTAYAKDQPETKISFYGGVYDKPQRKEMVWWQDGNPTYGGTNFYHAQKIKQFDIVVGGNLYNDEGYRYLETEQRYRTNANLRYRFGKKLQGLQVGVNFNTIRTKGGLFLIWENADSGAFRPAGGDLSHYTTYRSNIDPFITYNTKNNSRHTLRGRFFRTKNLNNTNQESTADVYYTEYQYQKRFENGLTWTAGGVYNYNEVHSGPLYGTHFSNNAALFTQIDRKWKKLSVSVGARCEYFKTDSIETQEDVYLFMDDSKPIVKRSKIKPVFRAGLNYHLLKATYVRASLGQGFRFPSVAERFIKTSASGLDIYPNDTLSPESGWSAEIGIKQGVKIGEWKGFVDVAGFWSEYKNMMEFAFGQYGSMYGPNYGLGFQSQNIGNTRIRGYEISILGAGKMGPLDVNMLMGYTYIDPIQTDFNYLEDTIKGTSNNNLLKYRYRHSGKADVELGYKKLSMGLSLRANSFMENIDRYFVVFFKGMQEYRAAHDQGDYIFDYRIAYQLNKTAKVTFIVNNMFNREVMGRPMDIQPPRVFAFQLTVKI
ncbi:MAG TPA: TonB-dependent receptor [Bacteroidia bacterium]|jgi:iron complex outermembrane receptor protein